MPIIYIDAYIQERKLDILPGGFNQTVIEWSPNLDYNILTTNSSRIFEVIPGTDAVVMNMYAYNHGDPTQEPEARYYDVIRKSRKSDVFSLEDGGDEEGDPLDMRSDVLNSASSSTKDSGELGIALLVLPTCFAIFLAYL